MNKNKIVIATLLTGIISLPVLAAPESITVDGGKINFTGAIVAAPCAVDNTSDGQTVRLGQVPTNRLNTKGDTSSTVPFTIKLIGCDLASADDSNQDATISYTSASITFNGSTVGDDTTLAIQSAASGAGDTTSAAQNVGVQIYDNNNQIVKVDGSTATPSHKLLNGTNEIPFSAAYIATADGVVAGSANSTVNFQVNYE
jgi:major type 1 subunit fimbrin (pilin)